MTELIFGIPGMGKYFVTSITNRDYPGHHGYDPVVCGIPGDCKPCVDLTYAYLDPRIRYD